MLLLAVPLIDREDEVQDTETFEEKDLGEMEQHKSVILHLLSQLKLGMDLTKVCAVLAVSGMLRQVLLLVSSLYLLQW